MKFAKYLFVAIIAAIKKEMTFQKPTAEQVMVMQACARCRPASRGSDAIKGLLLIIIAPIIFVILAGFIL